MNKDETRQLLAMIAATWPKFAVTKAAIDAWESPLRECDFEDCKAAIKRYQNPRNEEEARRCAFAPHPGDIFAICREIEGERVTVESEVRSCAARAVGRFPAKENEREAARELFYAMCMKQSNPVRTARLLEQYLNDTLREAETNFDKETGRYYIDILDPVEKVIKEASVYDE